MDIFPRLALITDVVGLVKALGALLSQADPLLPELENVALEIPSVVRHLSYTAALQFVGDCKNLYADAMVAYSGSAVQIADLIAAYRKLIADAHGG